MIAVLAAILFVIAAICRFTVLDDYVFWMLLGFAAVALHFAFKLAVPRLAARQESQ